MEETLAISSPHSFSTRWETLQLTGLSSRKSSQTNRTSTIPILPTNMGDCSERYGISRKQRQLPCLEIKKRQIFSIRNLMRNSTERLTQLRPNSSPYLKKSQDTSIIISTGQCRVFMISTKHTRHTLALSSLLLLSKQSQQFQAFLIPHWIDLQLMTTFMELLESWKELLMSCQLTVYWLTVRIMVLR